MRFSKSLVAVALFLILFTPNVEAETRRDELLAIVEQAELGQRQSLQSGVGRARFIMSGTAADPELALSQDANVFFAFDEVGRFHIHLQYTRDSHGLKERVIVYDGTSLISSSLTPSISVTGSEAENEVVSKSSAGLVRPQAALFPWDISKLALEVTSVPILVANVGRENISTKEAADGSVTIEHSLGKGHSSVDFSSRYGFRATDRRDFRSDGKVAYSIHMDWAEKDGIWYVSSVDSVLQDQAYRLTVEEFAPNAEIDPKLFHFEALKLKGGSRIIDRTLPIVSDAQPINYLPMEDRLVEASVRSIAETIESLPSRPEDSDRLSHDPPVSNRSVAIYVLVANAVIVVAIGLLVWRRAVRPK